MHNAARLAKAVPVLIYFKERDLCSVFKPATSE